VEELHISSLLKNTKNYTRLLRNAYLSSYAVIQLSKLESDLWSKRWPDVRSPM